MSTDIPETTAAAISAPSTFFGRIGAALSTQPPIERIEDPAKVKSLYAHWRVRVLYGSIAGYAMFYFVRKNVSIASKSICDEFHFTNTQWGNIMFFGTIVYAFSKFGSGVAGDRANPRFLLGLGLLLSAIVNLFFGFGASVLFFTVIWALNNLFQGTGVPPCVRLITHWFSPKEIGRAWGTWNASHQIGGTVIVLLAGWLIPTYGWRSAFWVPAIFCILGAFFVMNRLRDTPESLGLPPVEVFKGEVKGKVAAKPPFWLTFKTHILGNPWVWLVSLSNFFVYFVRTGIFDWGTKFLTESKGLTVPQASYALSAFEAAGLVGALVAGWLSDKAFRGRRAPVTIGYSAGLAGLLYVLFLVPEHSTWLTISLYSGLGFLVYGPQLLVAVAAADFATKSASASAVGLTGLFGYFGTALCSVATGRLVDARGWGAATWLYIGSAILVVVLVLPTWNMRAKVVAQHD